MTHPVTQANPTVEELALARKCTADHYAGTDTVDKTGQKMILAGAFDYWSEVQIALAAIRETTALARALAANHADQSDDTAVGRARNGTARDIYEALLTNAHLKGERHADA